MTHPDSPRRIIVLALAVILVTLLAGTLHLFLPAHAETSPVTIAAVPTLPNPPTPISTDTSTSLNGIASPTPTEVEETPTQTSTPAPTVTPVPLPIPPSADTTGIIALAIVVVMITVAGTAWGEAGLNRRKRTRK